MIWMSLGCGGARSAVTAVIGRICFAYSQARYPAGAGWRDAVIVRGLKRADRAYRLDFWMRHRPGSAERPAATGLAGRGVRPAGHRASGGVDVGAVGEQRRTKPCQGTV